MVKPNMSPVSIWVWLGAVVSAGTICGVTFYCWAKRLANIYGGTLFLHDDAYQRAQTFASLSGFCFDTAVIAILGALWLALRKQSRWQLVKVPFLVGGSLTLPAVTLAPIVLSEIEYDEFGFSRMLLFGCVLLAAAGAIMVTVAGVLALMGDGRHNKSGNLTKGLSSSEGLNND